MQIIRQDFTPRYQNLIHSIESDKEEDIRIPESFEKQFEKIEVEDFFPQSNEYRTKAQEVFLNLLHRQVFFGKEENVRDILPGLTKLKFDFSQPFPNDTWFVHECCFKFSSSLLKSILEIKKEYILSPNLLFDVNLEIENYGTPLFISCTQSGDRSYHLIKTLLSDDQIDPNKGCKGKTPLQFHWNTTPPNKNIVELFLKKEGINLSPLAEDGFTLRQSIKIKFPELSDFLD